MFQWSRPVRAHVDVFTGFIFSMTRVLIKRQPYFRFMYCKRSEESSFSMNRSERMSGLNSRMCRYEGGG